MDLFALEKGYLQPGGALGFEAGDFRFMGHGDANVVEAVEQTVFADGLNVKRNFFALRANHHLAL